MGAMYKGLTVCLIIIRWFVVSAGNHHLMGWQILYMVLLNLFLGSYGRTCSHYVHDGCFTVYYQIFYRSSQKPVVAMASESGPDQILLQDWLCRMTLHFLASYCCHRHLFISATSTLGLLNSHLLAGMGLSVAGIIIALDRLAQLLITPKAW